MNTSHVHAHDALQLKDNCWHHVVLLKQLAPRGDEEHGMVKDLATQKLLTASLTKMQSQASHVLAVLAHETLDDRPVNVDKVLLHLLLVIIASPTVVHKTVTHTQAASLSHAREHSSGVSMPHQHHRLQPHA